MTGRDDSLKSPTCVDFVNNCPNLTSLALRGFKLHDYKVRILVKVSLGISRINRPNVHILLHYSGHSVLFRSMLSGLSLFLTLCVYVSI